MTFISDSSLSPSGERLKCLRPSKLVFSLPYVSSQPAAVLTGVDREEGGTEAIEGAGLRLMHLFNRESLREGLPQTS